MLNLTKNLNKRMEIAGYCTFFNDKLKIRFLSNFFDFIYCLSSLNFPFLFPAKIAGKRGGKLSEERRYMFHPKYKLILLANHKICRIEVTLTTNDL